MSQKVSIGRIVHYRLSLHDADAINRRREHAQENYRFHERNKTGVQIHVGNRVKKGETVAMTITAVWEGDKVNGKAHLDGSDDLWVTSAQYDPKGKAAGTWSWPPRV